jgi:hypothetical protein
MSNDRFLASILTGFQICILLCGNANAQQSDGDLPNAPSEVSRAYEKPTQPQPLIAVPELKVESYRPAKTINRQFIVLNALLVASFLADAEVTLNCVASPGCREANPLLGNHPSRARLYSVGIPITVLSIAWSYHDKRKSPSRAGWKAYPIVFAAAHCAAVVTTLSIAPHH